MATLAAEPERRSNWLLRHWPLTLGVLALILPTLVRLAQENWTTEAGVQGPIILATGIWLFFSQRETVARHRSEGSFAVALALGVPLALAYVAGRALGFLVVEVGAAIALVELLVYLHIGWQASRRLWFPFLYLYFVAPLPGWFQDHLTGALKEWVSAAVTNFLAWCGLPVIRQGVVIYVAQYQLLVEDACSGLNSLTSLLAIGLFYVYVLHQASARYALALSATIFPIAVFANMIRVLILVLLTYYVSDEVAQGFLHKTAGMVTFIIALLTIMGLDALAQRLFLVRRQRA